jgi:hypothetical protein
LNNSTKKYCGIPYGEQGENGQRPPNPQNATRKFQKNVVQVWKITNYDRQTALFNGASMGAVTLRFSEVRRTRPSGRHGNFYQVAQGQHPLLCALSIAESLSCPKSTCIGPIGDTTIFQGQQYYSSCSKAGGCRGAQLLGGFRRDLLIVSWVAPTPGFTANFQGNRCSQPLILRPFGRSGEELPVEYQVESHFINFFGFYS